MEDSLNNDKKVADIKNHMDSLELNNTRTNNTITELSLVLGLVTEWRGQREKAETLKIGQ